MVRAKSDNLQGALDLLVLKALEDGPMHGWGITLHIERVSDEVLRVEEGSLYPALHRMEQERWIAAEWGRSENNRRARFYRLTSSGRQAVRLPSANTGGRLPTRLPLCWSSAGQRSRGFAMAWIRRLRALFRKEELESDFEEELQFHLSMREQRNVEQGMPNAEARRSARVRFGNPTVWRERMREIDLMTFPQTVMQDLRFGCRMLLRNAGFTAIAAFALAVGIGLDTAAFTAYQAFFERKLDARTIPLSMVNLALIEHTGATASIFSYPDYEIYRDHVRSFSGVIAASLPQYLTVSVPGGVVLQHNEGGGSLIGKLFTALRSATAKLQ